MAGAPHDVQIIPFRGDYYVLQPDKRYLCRGLIYPVPDPTLPFLGVHFTSAIDGEVWAGPNAVLAFAREGYTRTDINPGDLAELLALPRLLAHGRNYWRIGVDEMYRDFVKAAFVQGAATLCARHAERRLVPGPAGVRAQAVAADGAWWTTSWSMPRRTWSTSATPLRPPPPPPSPSPASSPTGRSSRAAVLQAA